MLMYSVGLFAYDVWVLIFVFCSEHVKPECSQEFPPRGTLVWKNSGLLKISRGQYQSRNNLCLGELHQITVCLFSFTSPANICIYVVSFINLCSSKPLRNLNNMQRPAGFYQRWHVVCSSSELIWPVCEAVVGCILCYPEMLYFWACCCCSQSKYKD